MIRRAIFALFLLWSSSPAFAQPLADRVPDDALAYIGWTGSRSMPKEFEGSHLQAVLDASNLREVFDEFLPRALRRLGQEDPQAQQALDLIAAIGGPLWRHPSAIYVGDVNFENPEGPSVQIALLCQAGDEAQALQDRISGILDRAGGNLPAPVQVTDYGGLVAVTANRSDDVDALLGGPTAVAPAPALSQSAKFADALKNVQQQDSVACAYVDVEGITRTIDAGVQATGDARANESWPKVRQALGLGGLHRIIWTGGFDGADFSHQAFAAMPAPRKGLLASLLSEEALSDEILKTVPRDATLVSAGQFDLARFFAELRSAIGQVDVGAQSQFDEALSAVNDMLGMSVQDDVLEPLGREWAIYCSPGVAGNGILGFAGVNRLDDAEKSGQSLSRLEALVANLIQQQIKDPKVQVRVRQTMVGDLDIHYWAIPFVSPAWAIKNGNLYIGLYPQVVAGAAQQVGAAGDDDSILNNEKFAAMRKRVAPDGRATALSFADLPATADEGYQGLLLISRLYLGLADLFGIDAPAMVVPPMHQLLPHLAPAGSVAWTDDAGWHARSISPFPAAEMMGSQSNLTASQSAMMLGILLPSLNRARDQARIVACSSDLRQIGLAMTMYANDHNGRYPQRLGELLPYTNGSPAIFICPAAGDELPDMHNMRADELSEWIDHHGRYVYLADGKRAQEITANDMLVCEHGDNHAGQGMNVLYGDGRVQWIRDAAVVGR